MEFPHPFVPDMSTRAGRMMAAGRVKVTMSSKSNTHITVLLKCIADNRQRQYNAESSKNWIECPLEDATHIFAEVPNASGQWNDKIGTFYPRNGRWYDADNADPVRVQAAMMVGLWLTNPDPLAPPAWWKDYTFKAAEECYVCGIELTHPDSLARGVGPECAKKGYKSIHQVKDTSIGHGVEVAEDLYGETKINFRSMPSGMLNLSKEQRTDIEAQRDLEQEDPMKAYSELGVTDSSLSAFARWINWLSEDQLEAMREVVDARLEAVKALRKRGVADAREAAEAPADLGFMAR